MFIELQERVPTLGDRELSVNVNNITFITGVDSKSCFVFFVGQEQEHKINMSRAELAAKLNEALRPK